MKIKEVIGAVLTSPQAAFLLLATSVAVLSCYLWPAVTPVVAGAAFFCSAVAVIVSLVVSRGVRIVAERQAAFEKFIGVDKEIVR